MKVGVRVRPATDSVRLMTGNEACAEAALAAGCRFFAGYPITPSSEIAETLADPSDTIEEMRCLAAAVAS